MNKKSASYVKSNSYKPKFGAQKLNDLLPEIVAESLRKRGFANIIIISEWREIVGANIADWVEPVEIRYPKKITSKNNQYDVKRIDKINLATLVVSSPAAFALELQMNKASILDAINRRLGYACLGFLEIRQTSNKAHKTDKQQPKLDENLVGKIENIMTNIQDEELRNSLAKLGASIWQKNNSKS